MDGHRNERVTETLREEVEEIINYELSDPRIGVVTVSEVLLSRNGRRARIRVALTGDAEEQNRSLNALGGARRRVRSLLASRLNLFRIPDLDFEADVPVASTSRLRQLLRRMRKGHPRDNEEGEKGGEGPKNPLG